MNIIRRHFFHVGAELKCSSDKNCTTKSFSFYLFQRTLGQTGVELPSLWVVTMQVNKKTEDSI